jgi:dipeptidyl aminopeptidase/acylaminoacyl peptidase
MVKRDWRTATTAAAIVLMQALPAPALAAVAEADCGDLLPPAERAIRGPRRAVTAADLVRLRDIGLPDGAYSGPSVLAVSPDGRQVAFVLSRADPGRNSHCRALVLMPIEPGARPRIIDRGGDLITLKTFVRGLAVDTGLPATVTPSWSPDGRWIAWLRRDEGATQAWLARPDGDRGRPVTRSTADVERLAWSRDGRRLLFTTRPGTVDAEKTIDREGASGWLYDDRVATNAGPRPRIREGDAPPVIMSLDPATGSVRAASAAEKGEYARDDSDGTNAITRVGRRAWLAPESSSIVSERRIWAIDAKGATVRCDVAQCLGVDHLWWSSKGDELRFLRREGWNREATALYRWRPGSSAPSRVFATEDAIQNCVVATERLLCSAENATTPRRLVLIDPVSGGRRMIFDLNPEFEAIHLGSVQRLRWRNEQGLEAWGDLVLPPRHRPGTRLPMIVVQYNSRGFLRGGTGDEYPIQLFAANGFAVLSFERPPSIAASVPGLRTEVEANAANYADWADRRSVLSSLLTGVELAIATGNVDPARVGITGLSDGATTVRFALINSRAFAAAAISSCCLEPKTAMTYGGIAWAQFNTAVGFPLATVDAPDFWRPMSLALNARKIDTPLLMQLSDDEHLLALEAFTALREQYKPVELHVFPDEHHVKWQPAHRLAIYTRNLDWFDFWLRCRIRNDAAGQAQARRWDALRARSPAPARICEPTTSP